MTDSIGNSLKNNQSALAVVSNNIQTSTPGLCPAELDIREISRHEMERFFWVRGPSPLESSGRMTRSSSLVRSSNTDLSGQTR